MNPFDLTGKVAIISGASRGIGEAIAITYAQAGAAVVLTSRKLENVGPVADKIKAAGGQALALAAHAGQEAEAEAVVTQAVGTFGRVDIVVNNAGTNPHFGPLLTAESSHWDKIFEVNVKGYFFLIKAAAPVMRRQGSGKIINIASIAGINPGPMMGVYSTSKAAVIMLTKALAAELGPENIQVNALAPGFIRTKFSAALWGNPALKEMLEKATPQRRIAPVDELTGAALYLASDASSFTTGSVLVVDGGFSLGALPIG
ncbi:glucose 1-dehydrogenase [Candidatus Amarolinea aalborgensis]|uniref:glucose 1-dehydrogenase n=1 Tax=Candidatus Amarolinea aalborgensis TaxID=2249329 RepID=UPI003BF9C619